MRWIGALAVALFLAANGTATACQGRGTPLLDDDFKNPDIGWGTPTSVASYTPDGLVLRPPVNGSGWRWNQNFSMAHADLCAEVANPANLPSPANQKTVGDVGLWFWGADAQNFYTATITLDGTAAVDRLENGVWHEVVAPVRAPSIKTAAGAVNEIEIETSGNTATLLVNGRRIAQFRGQPPAGGGPPGVYGESGATVTTWKFPRVRLY
jgi:hypothetical protein